MAGAARRIPLRTILQRGQKVLEGQPETPANLPPGSRIFNNKTRLLLIGIVLVLALGYLIYAAFPGNTLYYLTVDEFVADDQSKDGRSVRVVGRLMPDSFERVSLDGRPTTQATFILTDNDQVMNATYTGTVPDLFFNPHSDVVLEGSYGDDDVFHADTVIVKCPSKYQALTEES
jgi:cytochrome c-type biogenesis protein CcmE